MKMVNPKTLVSCNSTAKAPFSVLSVTLHKKSRYPFPLIGVTQRVYDPTFLFNEQVEEKVERGK